ncbi:MAG TPA: hypothetical protein VIA62_17015 [Thermoanaerobaculia bacterium]|jgi:hypothetical protein|nr:hypothetical protein [Thermoanaerobaculia bacterium]
MDHDAWARAARNAAPVSATLALTFALGLAVTPLAAQTPAPAPAPQAAAPAQDPVADLRTQLEALKAEYERRIADLEKRLSELQAAQGQAPAPGAPAAPATAEATPPPAPAPEAAPAQPAVPEGAAVPATEPGPGAGGAGGASQTSNYFNPSVSVIGNFLAVAGQNRTENLPSAELRESELGIQAIVDPYARADFFISFGEHNVDVEEGFVTFTALPQSLLAKVGRMRAYFGKVNTLHLHVLPWPDEPLPVVNLLGSDGWIGTGVSVARLLPIGDTFTEGTLQIFRGQAEDLFEEQRRSDLAYNGHYRVFKDLTDASNLDLGLSYATGPNGATPSSRTRLEGLDATYRWKPLQTATYRSVTLRGELFRSLRDQPGGVQRAIGWFAAGDYQLAKRWFVGARYETSDLARDASKRDTGEAATLTFWPSEFSQLRAELRRRHYSLTDETANELLLQLQFAIGAHGAHPF